MMRTVLVFALMLALLGAGCLKPVQDMGCCLKDNISQGCVLYNTTDFTNKSYIDKTNGPCDSNDTAYNTTGSCNVTLGSSTYLVPICSQDQLVSCINQNCTTMVCGDFVFKPRFAPGFSTTGNDTENTDDDTESAAGNIPPDTGEGGAANFYKAQCRFFTMDAKLRQIMKSSASSINVFRIGVGGSFDEYDQYRYFLPLSDKYCSINPPMAGESRVDRYMNYLTSSKTAYDPENNISQNCLRDDVSSPFGSPSPFGFSETGAAKFGVISGYGGFTYTPVVPDASNYKFSHFATAVYPMQWNDWGGYRYQPAVARQDAVYKKIDEAYYRKELSIAHAKTMYGLTSAKTTKAPFECNSVSNDCYSNSCDTRVYSRGVLVTSPLGLTDGDEVVADCNKASDNEGNTMVVCAPTTSVADAGAGNPPTRTYATLQVYPTHFQVYESDNDNFEQSDASGENAFDGYWDAFGTASDYESVVGGAEVTVTNTPYVDYYFTEKRNCKKDYGENNDTTQVLCSSPWETSYQPPAAGAVFFGKVGGEELTYNGQTVIGYALASDTDFKNMLVVKNCGMKENQDYVKVTLTSTFDSEAQALLATFKPYFQRKVKGMTSAGFDDGCGEEIQPVDTVLSSVPWIVSYTKGVYDEALIGTDEFEPINTHLSSVSGQYLRERNIFNQGMTPYAGTESCDLRRDVYVWFIGDTHYYYNIAFSKNVYLFLYQDGSNEIGSCSVSESDLLPEVRTYGWCTPCTTSTLALQSVSAYDRVYMPGYRNNIETGGNVESVCVADYPTGWEAWTGFQETDNVSCSNSYITDINEYKDSIGSIGSPRTSPEASAMKERIGNYMKSGVMPVFDMSADSNWNIANPDSGGDGFFLFYLGGDAAKNYSQYDFQRLFGNEGAAVVIVDHVSGTPDNAKMERIIERAAIVRERCFGCLTAFHVDSPASNTSFNQTVNDIMIDPRAQFSVDMVTFDYPISSHSSVVSGISDPKNRSVAIAKDIASYGRAALQSRRIPSMVVGLNVKSNDGYWNDANYKTLFENIVLTQDELVRAGVVGMIYAPARDAAGGVGIVQTSGNVGSKTAKFCAIENALQKMSLGEAVALFSRSNSVKAVNCTKCTTLDKHGTGVCSDYAIDSGNDPEMCDNGVMCVVPGSEEEAHTYTCSCDGGIDSVCQVCDEENTCVPVGESCPDLTPVPSTVKWKCPENTVVDECEICNETSGTYSCTIKYTNGTVQNLTSRSFSELGSDLYMDIIGGFSKPEKCCLKNQNVTYTYTKQTFQNAINKPIVFPRTGDPDVDCGMGDPNMLTSLSSFCGIQLPLREYDINCSVD